MKKSSPNLKMFKNLIVYTVIAVFSITSIFAQSTGCEAEIGAVKNRDNKGVSSGGTYYKLMITNNGNAADTYVLSSKDINSTSSNIDNSSTASNVVLNYNFIDLDKNPISEISLNIGESYTFIVSVTVPSGTVIEKWSCIEITASSKSCENYSTSTILKTFVLDPNEG